MFKKNLIDEKKQFLELLSKIYNDKENLSEEFKATIVHVASLVDKLKEGDTIKFIAAKFSNDLAFEANRLTANKLKFPEGYNELFKFLAEKRTKFINTSMGYMGTF
ncbi:hypothetical protein [Gemelliphila palaticanis]|uniref:Enterocin A Immunity n=1 Tax=Gemelliphila palaticanis TaxID=81950 RepID=A0ABX2SY41_9BACL|nr:hypothetical protein [Gemella palaticanis]MBF0715185.1 hypothetical protein [Gemella palaticanis]NYS47115.1 hypothetical protein [Gemella palaticanis]